MIFYANSEHRAQNGHGSCSCILSVTKKLNKKGENMKSRSIKKLMAAATPNLPWQIIHASGGIGGFYELRMGYHASCAAISLEWTSSSDGFQLGGSCTIKEAKKYLSGKEERELAEEQENIRLIGETEEALIKLYQLPEMK